MAKKQNKISPAKVKTIINLDRFQMKPPPPASAFKNKKSPMKVIPVIAAVVAKATAAKVAAAALAKAAAAKIAAATVAKVAGKAIVKGAIKGVVKKAGVNVAKNTLIRGTGKKILAKAAGKFGGKATNLISKKAGKIVGKVASKTLKPVSTLTKIKKGIGAAKTVYGKAQQVGSVAQSIDSGRKSAPVENTGMSDFAKIDFSNNSNRRRVPFQMKRSKK